MPAEFILIDRDTPQLFPASVQDYVPEKHLARFVVEIIDQLDLKLLVGAYRGTGSAAYHPAMLVALLFYGYATGVFSSRKLAQATYDSIACRFICANSHPDHRTIADFRKRFLGELEALFVEILLIGQAMGLVKLGTVSRDGTKIKANASKHKALSWAHANRLEEQLKDEVAELMRLAEQADNHALPEQMDIPLELERREQRLEVIAAAKAEIAARAQERFEREQGEYEEKQAKREAHEKKTGKKPSGKAPKPPTPGPQRQGSGQPHRCGIAHHADLQRRVRAGLQRPGRRRHRHPSDRRRARHSAHQRQAGSRSGPGEPRRPPRRAR